MKQIKDTNSKISGDIMYLSQFKNRSPNLRMNENLQTL